MGRGGGGGGRGGGDLNADRPAVEIPRYVNPINLLIQHRQDLALSDSQFARVIRVKRSVDSTNAPFMRRLDSVQVLFKGRGPLFGDASPQRRDSLASARDVVRETIGSVRDNLGDARDRAYSLLSASQVAKAQDYEQAEARNIEEAESRSNGSGNSHGGIGAGRPPT
ncbi:MAG TPA: hypothetical protein VHV78_08165 [Gemmatimonadaceae bacterium]|nr:hypothetical protein [Gemmatimonadaceae bacterium]